METQVQTRPKTIDLYAFFRNALSVLYHLHLQYLNSLSIRLLTTTLSFLFLSDMSEDSGVKTKLRALHDELKSGNYPSLPPAGDDILQHNVLKSRQNIVDLLYQSININTFHRL